LRQNFVRYSQEMRQFGLAVISAVAVLLAGGLLGAKTEEAYRQRSVQQTRVQADILAAGVAGALAFDDQQTIAENVSTLRRNPQIVAVGVYGADGRLTAQSTTPGQAGPPAAAPPTSARYYRQGVVVASPVVQQGVRLGEVYLRTAPEKLTDTLRRHGGLALLVIMAVLALALLARNTAELQRRALALEEANRRLLREMDEKAKAEEALRQSQKMEALGQLTGGVAHDFNNLLTVILGGLETIGRASPPTPNDPRSARLHRARDMAAQAAQRAATLTSRLLAFARRQPLEPKAIDVNRMVAGLADLMRSTLGEAVQVETVLGAGTWLTLADISQLESALLNLAVNARDAMPDGGKLTIETANAALDDGYVAAQAEAVLAGQYVMLAVTDTGTGMDKETLEHAVEPFFTTKAVGKGTGLGLSQVYGFVRQSAGHIRIYSEPGEGTTIRLYLPRYLAAEFAPQDRPDETLPGLLVGDETVLLVEDHDDLRTHSAGLLRELGYRVIEAADGLSALAALADNPDVALLFTDVVLPGGMNGRQIAEAAWDLRPGLKVLFTTGYTRNAIVHNGALDPGVQLIAKPYSFSELAAKVRRVLDQ
jgi:signal transduction histidine kinase